MAFEYNGEEMTEKRSQFMELNKCLQESQTIIKEKIKFLQHYVEYNIHLLLIETTQ